MSIQDPLLVGVLLAIGVCAYVLGVLSFYVFNRYSLKALNYHTRTQQMHTDHPGKASSHGIDGSNNPVRATSPVHLSFTKGNESNGSLSSKAHGSKLALHSDVEFGPHPGMVAFSQPHFSPTHANFASKGRPQTPGSATVSAQSLVSGTLISSAMPRRPTVEDWKPIPLVKISTVTSEQPVPVNHARSYSVPVPSSPVVQWPESPVPWHLPSRSRPMTDHLKYEHSDSEYSLSGIPTPSPTATPDAEVTNQPIVLGTKISEAARALTPSSSVYSDAPLSVRDSTPSPTPESAMQLYKSFPAPPHSHPKENTADTPPLSASDTPAPAPPTAWPIAAPKKGPVRPLTIQTHRGYSASVTSLQHQGLLKRSHTASQAGEFSAPTSRRSSSSSQATLVSPKRMYKSASARGSLVSLAEDSFLVPPRTPPTPRLAPSLSLSNLRPKTSTRPVPLRNAFYLSSGLSKPQPEDRLSFECKGELSMTSPEHFTPRSL